MSTNPLQELRQAGQSIWLDNITRGFMAEGKLKKLIDEDGLSGVTSNPTIFQKAMAGGTDYDTSIQELVLKDTVTPRIFELMAIADIQQACDLFRPVWEKTKGADGYVSLEVNPHLARDTKGTLEEARRLFKEVARPNVMIKIPATKEGLPAIQQAIGEGININITLIFALERYAEVVEAWLNGLEQLAKSDKALSSVASVASFFVSRVDTLVDNQLERKGRKDLMGKAAIANAKTAYQMFLKTIWGARFKALQGKGARVQRPLWASTSTKNAAYRDVIYVEELIGPDTVNTLPPATLDAFRDHGRVRLSLAEKPEMNERVLAQLKDASIDMKKVTQQLEEEGLKLFAESYDKLIDSLDEKRQSMKVTR